jgi:ribosome-associated translation inhibitor RaiA
MQLPLQIAVRNTEITDDVEALIRRSAARLDQQYDRVTACRILVEVPQRHRSGAPILYNARLDITVPGGEIVIKRKPRDDLLTAVQDAFEAAGRRLQDFVRRRRGDIKPRMTPLRAVVRRLFPYEGYGFLEAPDWFRRASPRIQVLCARIACWLDVEGRAA